MGSYTNNDDLYHELNNPCCPHLHTEISRLNNQIREAIGIAETGEPGYVMTEGKPVEWLQLLNGLAEDYQEEKTRAEKAERVGLRIQLQNNELKARVAELEKEKCPRWADCPDQGCRHGDPGCK
jgi:hypothetical protein